MRTLNANEIVCIGGADTPAMGPYDAPPAQNGAACANAILVWGGIGSGLGSLVGGIIGFFAGAAVGGYFGTQATICKPNLP